MLPSLLSKRPDFLWNASLQLFVPLNKDFVDAVIHSMDLGVDWDDSDVEMVQYLSDDGFFDDGVSDVAFPTTDFSTTSYN